MTEADLEVTWVKLRYNNYNTISGDYREGKILHMQRVQNADSGEYRVVVRRRLDGSFLGQSSVIYLVVHILGAC
jgi:hypothetical protein